MSNRWIEALKGSESGRRALERERLLLETTEAISSLMDHQGLNKAQLAEKLGRSPAFVTKILRGTNNFTLSTLVDVFFTLDRSVHVSLAPLGDEMRVPTELDHVRMQEPFDWNQHFAHFVKRDASPYASCPQPTASQRSWQAPANLTFATAA
jgi:transcriptional regulator with XRE-family HTH domain